MGYYVTFVKHHFQIMLFAVCAGLLRESDDMILREVTIFSLQCSKIPHLYFQIRMNIFCDTLIGQIIKIIDKVK